MLVAVLLGFGVLMVYSASVTSRPSEAEEIYLSRHLAFVGVGLVLAVARRVRPEPLPGPARIARPDAGGRPDSAE